MFDKNLVGHFRFLSYGTLTIFFFVKRLFTQKQKDNNYFCPLSFHIFICIRSSFIFKIIDRMLLVNQESEPFYRNFVVEDKEVETL